MYTYHGVTIQANEILKYSRKSRTDDPLMTVEEVLEKHEAILNEWALRNLGEAIPAGNSFQEIVSGETIEARPDFQKILRLIESPKYKAILVVDTQRLSRGDLEDAGRLIKLLRYTNTFVITPDMAFDLGEEYDRERFKRELERGNDYLEYYKKINWRGRLESVKSGYFIGSIAPYGYDKDFIQDGRKKRPTLKINEREAEVVRIIFDLYANQNMGMTNIAHHLNALGHKPRNSENWKTVSIRDILMNVHYVGKIKWNWRKTVNVVEDGEISKTRPKSKDFYIFDGKHPAIIDDELFERAQAKMGQSPRTATSKKLANPLAGLVFCQCGRAMAYRQNKDAEGNDKNAPRLLCNDQVYCHTQSVVFDEVLEKIKDVLRDCIRDCEIKIKNEGKNTLINRNANIKRLEAKLEELNKKELSQWEKYSEEAMPKAVFEKLNAKVLAEKESATKALELARSSAPTVEDFQERKMLFSDALSVLNNPTASAEEKNRLLKNCIKRITYSRPSGGNRWNYTPFTLDVEMNVLPF